MELTKEFLITQVYYDKEQDVWIDKRSCRPLDTVKMAGKMCASINGDWYPVRILRSVYLTGRLNRDHRSNRRTTSSGGVVLHKASGRYIARIYADGKQKHLGYYDTEEAAINAVTIEKFRRSIDTPLLKGL